MGGSPAERTLRYVAKQAAREQQHLIKPSSSAIDIRDHTNNNNNTGRCLEMEQDELLLQDYSRTESEIDLNATKRSVSFCNVEIRNHCIVIGDHPCCTMGCPLTLGWDYTDAATVTLETYEATRAPRRTRAALRTSQEERRTMLADEHSDGEIRRAQRKLHRERSCSARLCERMTESFFAECEITTPPSVGR